jgi:hypothetical protein
MEQIDQAASTGAAPTGDRHRRRSARHDRRHDASTGVLSFDRKWHRAVPDYLHGSHPSAAGRIDAIKLGSWPGIAWL